MIPSLYSLSRVHEYYEIPGEYYVFKPLILCLFALYTAVSPSHKHELRKQQSNRYIVFFNSTSKNCRDVIFFRLKICKQKLVFLI